MAKVGTVVIEIDANTAKLVQGIKKSNNQISKMQKSVNRAKSSMANFAKAVIGIYAVEKAFSSAAKAATAFIKTAAQFEQYETTLRSITGSSEQAKKSMDWISDFTAKTPFKLAQVTEAFVKMKAYGLDPTDGTLKTLGNTASAMGKDINQAVEAMADAVTGENERLKEFGIKASKQGEKVAYAWSDSSGKSRNIVIKNNKDMIESTLNAIFNEKYIGAMEAQSNTWNGIVSNMSDKWTMFKRDVMSEGLFVYFKSLARVISSYMSAAFGDAKSSAKRFSDGAIEYVNGIIRAMGFLKDVISGMSLAFKAIEYAVLFMSKAVMQALNAPMQAINYLIDRYNALGDVLGYQKASMKAPTIDTTWTDSTMAQLKKEMSSIVDDLANDSGQKLAEKVIGKTKEGIAGVTSELDKLSSKKDEYRDTLDLIGAGYGGLSTSSKKAAKGADTLYKKYLELTGQKDKLFQFDVDKTMKEFIKSGKYSAGQLSKIYDAMWEKYKKSGEDANKGIVSTIQEAVSSIANAYRDGGMAAVGDQIGDMVVNGLNSVMSGLGTALEAVGALFSSQVTQAEIDASVGQVEFNDDSLKNLEAVFENAQYPMLEVTNKMYKHIRNMDANFYSIARAMSSQASSGGIDLTGVNFVDTFESGFLGFSSKSISLIGTGLKFELQNLSELMDEATLSVHSYTTKLVKKSSWWGLKKSSKIRETYKDLPTSVRDDIAKSFANGFESILTAGVTLGLGKIDLKQLLLDSEVDLGKIDFTELSPSEVSDRLSQVFSEAFSGVIAGIDGLDALTDRYAKNSEYALETLSRIAVQYDQAAHMFMLIGKKFE
ncbi:MAG: tape measure protein, partial [Sulfurimonas sp.]